MRVFVAGAGGALGRRVVPQLAVRGHDVFASTTRAEKIPGLPKRELGWEWRWTWHEGFRDGLTEPHLAVVSGGVEPQLREAV